VPEAVAVNIRGRSYKIAAEVDIETPEATGVVFAHGHRFGGHALYLKGGRLRYVYNYLGMAEQMVSSESDLPGGPCILGVEFTKEQQTPEATTGTLALYVDDEKVDELSEVKIQNGKFALCGEGLNIGRDGGAPVSADYPLERPWALVGATIRQVIVDVSGEPYLDLEMEAVAMMKRD